MRSKAIIFLLLALTLFNSSFAQPPELKVIAMAKEKAFASNADDSVFLNSCFQIAEAYMELNMYDSGQIWLNKIAERVPLRKPSFFNFYLSVDQAETYYYNGLKMMDLQESERLLRIAGDINDSILLATGNNFVGLAFMNIDSLRKAIPYFLAGIQYAKQPPYPPQYLSASKPHHLYGNLAEAYYKLGMYDSAMLLAYQARRLATEIAWPRGIAVASNLLGLVYWQKFKPDSALSFLRTAISIGLEKNQPDVALISMGAAADFYESKGMRDSVLALLNRGFSLYKENPFVNSLFATLFLDDAIRLYKKMQLDKPLIAAMEMKAEIIRQLAKKSDAQIGTLVKGSVRNEIRAANLELEEAIQKQALSNTRLIIALLGLLSMVILLLINRRYHGNQLKEIEIRNKISRDLHDDIGATLSSIQIYSELADKVLDKAPASTREMITKITVQSKDLMLRMGDVIWSMKPVKDDKNSVTSRLKNFSNELLTPMNIMCEFIIDESVAKKIGSPITRKNILLIAKEAMNNIAKYSNATEAQVSLKQQDQSVRLIISDNGNGFELNTIKQGNGLQNIQQRCKELGGHCFIQSAVGQGTKLACTFSIATISHNV